METTIEQIKAKIDIVDFIGSYTTLKKAGRNFKANCPFHQEKSPSFVVSPERQIWHCFGSCGDGGDIIKFLMKWENITFYEALKELAQKAGVVLQNVNFEDKVWQKKEKILKINYLTAEFYSYILQNTPFGEKSRTYLEERKIHPKIIKTLQIGYAPNSWDSLLRFLKKKQYSEEEILAAGLLIKTDKNRFYDRFRGRLIFPIKDVRGNVIGFSGRLVENNLKEAKYINTPETEVYHKRESLFGIQLAKEAIKKEQNVVLVEGEFDMITPYQHGIENIVAIKGSALTTDQLTILKRLTPKITFALDMDSAGTEAIKRGAKEAEKMDLELRVAIFVDGKDPDEAMKNNPLDFKKAIANAVSIYDFIIDVARKKYGEETPFSRKKIGEEVIPFIAEISNPIIQNYYVKKLGKLLDVDMHSIEELINRFHKKQSVKIFLPSEIKEKKKNRREDMLQQYVLSYIFQQDDVRNSADDVFLELQTDDFSIPAYQKIAQLLIEYTSTHSGMVKLNEFCNLLPPELKSVCDELCLLSFDSIGFKMENVKKSVLELKKISLKKKIALMAKSSEAAYDKNLVFFTTALKEVEKKMNELYNYTV